MSKAAQRLIALMLIDVQKLMRALEGGAQTVETWRQAFSDALAKYHTASLLVGQGNRALTDAGKTWLGKTVQSQIGFLEKRSGMLCVHNVITVVCAVGRKRG